MVARKKLTKLARIGISHTDKAKALAANGMYGEALSELRIALFSLRSENRDGRLNEEIASVLNSIGMMNLLLLKYAEAQVAYMDAVAIRRPMTNSPEIAGSLIGLSESYRGTCEFEKSEETLQEALHIALFQKNDALASRVIAMLDMLERTQDNLPAGESDCSNDCYVASEFTAVHAVLRNIELTISPDGVSLGLVIGFPGIEAGLLSRTRELSPVVGIFFIEKSGVLTEVSVVNEEETEHPCVAEPFDGVLFAPGSYHKNGPLPIPICKKFTFTTGRGSLLKWVLNPNGWYRADLKLDIPDIRDGFKLMLALPYYLRLHKIMVDVKKPLEYGLLSIDEGTYHVTRHPDRVKPGYNLPYAFKRRLFSGSAFGLIDIPADSSLKYGVISFELNRT